MSKKVTVTREQYRKIHEDIDASTIPQELKAVYMLANALQLMVDTSFRRIRSVYAKHGALIDGNDLLKGITDYCKMTKAASWQFFNRIEPQINGATFEVGRDAAEGADAYDNFNEDCNEIVRLVLLYLDRTAGNEKWRDVFTMLRRMPTTGKFNDEDYTRYKMKRM